MALKPVVLLTFANPASSREGYLRKLAEETRRLRELFAPAVQRELCQVEIRTNVTAKDVFDAFQEFRDRIAIFHFGGHAGSYELLLEKASGESAYADAHGLAGFLGEQKGVQLVFLNGCSTEPQIELLLKAGVNAVIGTSRAIDDEIATDFAARFYNGLLTGADLARAFAEAENDARSSGGGQVRGVMVKEVDGKPLPEEIMDGWPWRLRYKPGAEGTALWNLPDAAGNPLYALPSLPAMALPTAPYRNILWFERKDAPIFFGRGKEIRDLYHALTPQQGETLADTNPLILYYGQSGVGKSSLLAAGLLPRLEQKQRVLYLRREESIGLLGTLATALHAEYVALPEDAKGKDPGDPETMPSLRTMWLAVETRHAKPLTVILDQVEEGFTRARKDTPDEMKPLFDDLAGLLIEEGLAADAQRLQGKLVLSFRKEWLADIEKLVADRRIPVRKESLLRLEHRGVVESITGPARDKRLVAQYKLTVEEGLADRIATELLADPNSPVAPTLQILLDRMWKAAYQRAPSAPTFDTALFDQLRSEGLLLEDFLRTQIEKLEKRQPAIVASGLALDLLAYHTTELGTSKERTSSEIDAAYTHQREAMPDLLQACRDLYLLADPRSDAITAERSTRLAHDTLAPLVRRDFEQSSLPGQRAWRTIKNRSVEWNPNNPAATRTPLDDEDLAVVKKGLAGMRALAKHEEEMLEESRRKYEEDLEVARRQARMMEEAREAAENAARLQEQADLNRIIAEQNEQAAKLVAEEEKKRAETLQQLAEEQQKRAEAQELLAAEEKKRAAAQETIAEEERKRAEAQRKHAELRTKVARALGVVALAMFGFVVLTVVFWQRSERDKGIAQNAQATATLALATAEVDRGIAVKAQGTAEADREVARYAQATATYALATAEADRGLAVEAEATAVAAKAEVDRLNLLVRGEQLTAIGYQFVSEEPMRALLLAVEGLRMIGSVPSSTESAATTVVTSYASDSSGGIVDQIGTLGKARDSAYSNVNGLLQIVKGVPVVGHSDTVDDVAISPDGRWLGTFSSDGTARLWDMLAANTSENHIILSGHTASVSAAAFSPDGRWLATGSYDNTARLWDMSSGDPSQGSVELAGHTSWVYAITFMADSPWLITASEDGTVRLWDLASEDPRQSSLVIASTTGSVRQIAVSPDDRWIAMSSDEGNEVQVVDLKTSDPSRSFVLQHSHEGDITDLEFSVNSRWLATSSSNKTVHLWDVFAELDTQEPVVLGGHTDTVYAIAFSPDGIWLATASFDGTARLWDMATVDGTPFLDPITLVGHERAVWDVLFSPDGRWLATGADDGVRLWPVADRGTTYTPVVGHTGAVTSLFFSPDGRWLVTGSMDNTARLWSLDQDTEPIGQELLLEETCSRIGRNLTSEEWQEFIAGERMNEMSDLELGLLDERMDELHQGFVPKTCPEWPAEPADERLMETISS